MRTNCSSDVIYHLTQSLADHPAVDLITPADPRYATARLVFNRMHDCYPRLIVRTLDVDVLRNIMQYSFERHITIAIRGGGHHIAGFATCDDGIVLDFSPFKAIHIDKMNNQVSVEPGVRLCDLDEALTKEGYVVPTGTISDTGLAGLTLGGGIGWLIGKYALTCDHLCGADVLLADGRLVKAEDPAHQDLLWALRGGGGNFGVVLQFRYQLQPLPKTICGMGFVAWDNAAKVMNQLAAYLQHHCPPSMTAAPVLIKDKLGNPHLRIDFCCANGNTEEVISLTSLSELITWSNVREWEFAAWQKEFDQAFLSPMRGYWKACYLETMTPELVEKLCEHFVHSPTNTCSILIEHLHGAFKSYDQRTSAFPLRHCNFGILLSARWEKDNQDEENIHWVKNTFSAIDPQETTGTYLNYTQENDARAVHFLIKNTFSQIARVKSIYDPNNYFKRNHNVRPIRSS